MKGNGTMKRGACLALACLACWFLLVDEGEAQRVVGRHPGTIYQAALSSDGEMLATGDTNRLVRIWDAETGRMIHSMEAPRWEGEWLGFKGGGRYLAVFSFLEIRIWDAATGELKSVSEELDRVGAFAFSPDGQTIAAGKWDNAIQLWDVETGQLKREMEPVSDRIYGLIFSHDGRLAAGAGDEEVYIWDAATGELKTRFATPVDSRRWRPYLHDYRIAFLPGNRSIASLSHTRYDQKDHAAVHVWDAETGQNQFEFGEGLTDAMLAPDGSALAAYSGGKARLWDLKTGEELTAFEEGFSRPIFSSDSRLMAASRDNRESDTRTIQIWDVETRKLLSVVESDYRNRILLSSNGLLARTGGPFQDKEFTRWDIQGRQTAQFSVGGSLEIASVSFSPDGRSVASSCAEGWLWGTDDAIRIWDVSTGEELRNIRAYPGPSAFSPDGRTIACVSPKSYAIAVWDAKTGEPIVELRDQSPSSFAYSPDGKTIAFNSNAYKREGVVRFLDISTGKVEEKLTAPSGRASELKFSQDGTVLAAAGMESVHLWDVDTREILRTVEGFGSVHALALSPIGGSIAVGGEDSIVRVWSAKNGALTGKMIGHEGAVHAVAYSPDGQRIASGGKDGTVRIWSAKTFQLEKTLRGHFGHVNAVAFSPDSRSLVSGGKDGRILLWRFDDLPILWSDAKRPNSPLFLKNALLPNYPNPFNPETWIPFDLAQESSVTIAIYNSAGQTVRRMELGELPAGSYRAKGKAAYWDGRDALGAPAASGVYFVRIEAGSFSETRRMVLLK